ncbi:MAG TPA: hypothetical protein VMM77_09210 [Gemmatimonadaceae bacterium]|nr:hypothetical protein [Gemmatimonadaceae bacterium]
MSRSVAAFTAAGLAALLGVVPSTAVAQQWNDERSLALVTRATELRDRQLADTALIDYRATAHGYLTFLAQLGEGFTEPPRIVKADELALEVYWRAPNLSKQRIVGRRDTLLLPTDINYHRDHLGIVQNNFPDIIRLGEGDEVADVPHPLSIAGITAYDFSIRDSLTLELPDRAIRVTEVLVRPKDDRMPRLIGAIYLDRGSGEVVRMSFNFTRSAFLDRQLEDLFITIENALVGGQYWLPRRQAIEIRRSGTWLDYPVRGIIRGRWDICCYELNVGLDPNFFQGPEIVQAPVRERLRHRWEGSVLDGLPDEVRAVADEDVRRVQEEARQLVRQQALSRARGATISARRLSDFVRVNRAEGLALGAGTTLRLGSGVRAEIAGRWGFADDEAKGRAALVWERADGIGVGAFGERAYREAGDVAEVSLVRNSIAAQELGSDYTDPFDARAVGVWLALGERAGLHLRLEGAVERHGRLAVNASPSFGAYEPVIQAWSLDARRLSLTMERPLRAGPWGTAIRGDGELRALRYSGRDTVLAGEPRWLARAFANLEVERPYGTGRLVLRTLAGAVDRTGAVPPQALVYLGGPISAPGYDYHFLGAPRAFSQRVEWQVPVPVPAVPLGRFGGTPATATLAPFVSVAWAGGQGAGPRSGWYPSVGLGMLAFFDLLRIDVARGLNDGRWSFSLDLTRDFWRIL